MIALFVIGILATFCGFIARYPKTKWGLSVSFLIITVFMSIRYMWGNDMPSYYEGFTFINSFSGNDLFNLDTLNYRGDKGEYGWTILNILCKPIGFLGMQIVLSVFQSWVVYRFIKDNVSPKWYWFAVFLYCFDASFLVLSSSMMRQSLAMWIFLLAVGYMVKRKIIPYVLLVLLASTFHQSAIYLLPFYFIRYFNFKISYRHLFVIIPLLIVWKMIAPRLLGAGLASYVEETETYAMYLGGKQAQGQLGLGVGVLFNIYLLCFMIAQLHTFPDKQRLFAILGLMTVLFQPLQTVIPMIGRMALYFQAFTIVSYPVLMDRFKGDKIIINATVLVFCLTTIKDLISFFYNPTFAEAYMEYHTIFELGSVY